jgi:hypothetical protein
MLYIEPIKPSAAFDSALHKAIDGLTDRWPGLSLVKAPKGWSVSIPDKYNLDHEATFAEVTKKYLGYVKQGTLPDWEVPNMLAKYYTTVKALEMARKSVK